MSYAAITDKAANTMFWGELFRGAAITLGTVFKEPATINYPFEKGPLSPRYSDVYFCFNVCAIIETKCLFS